MAPIILVGVFGHDEKVQKPARPEGLPTAHLFGPPPILEGEDADAYNEILDRVFGAVAPTDFIEDIWVRDLVDVTWNMFRLRRLRASFWSHDVSIIAHDRAKSCGMEEAARIEGPLKEEMGRLLDSNSRLSWEERVEQNPRANEEY